MDVVQWSEDLYEEQLVERTIDACGDLVDIVIDFSATGPSIRRTMKCLKPVSIYMVIDLPFFSCALVATIHQELEDRPTEKS